MSEFTLIAVLFGSLIIGGFGTLYIFKDTKLFTPFILLCINALVAAGFRVSALLIGGSSGLSAAYKDDLVALMDVFFGISVYVGLFAFSITLILLLIQIFGYFFYGKRENSLNIRMEDDRI